MMNKFSMVLMMAIASTVAQAQTVTVKKQTEQVKGDKSEGYSAVLDGKQAEVSGAWTKFLKEIGRIKLFSSDPVVITDPNFNGTVYPKGVVYANIFDNGNQTRVWLGILSKEWEEKDVEVANRFLEKLVYQFGVQFNRSKVQSQIDETNQAIAAVEKQQQRLLSQNKEFTIQLGNNDQERLQLQKALEANKLENEALKIKIDKNKKAQDSLVNAIGQIKKMLETHRERLRKIN